MSIQIYTLSVALIHGTMQWLPPFWVDFSTENNPIAAPRQAALLHSGSLPSPPPFAECFRERQVQGLRNETAAKRVENLEEQKKKTVTTSIILIG